jgi:hypothetical protein
MHKRLLLTFIATSLSACGPNNEVDAGMDPGDASLDGGGGADGGDPDAGDSGSLDAGSDEDGGRDAGTPTGVVECTGRVNQVNYKTASDPFGGGLSFGDTVTLRFDLDPDGVDGDDRPNRGTYEIAVPPGGIAVRLGSVNVNPITPDRSPDGGGPVGGTRCFACTGNDDSGDTGFGDCGGSPGTPVHDNYELVCLNEAAGGGGVSEIYVLFRDRSEGWRSSDSHPSIEDLRAFDFSGDIVTEFGVWGYLSAAPVEEDEWSVFGEITECH